MRNLLLTLTLLVAAPSLAQSSRRTREAPRSSFEPAQALYFGGYAGLLVPLDDEGETAPQLGLQLSGPLGLGDGDSLRLEWTGALDFSFYRTETFTTSGAQVASSSGFTFGVMPGLRLLVPLHPRLQLHADVAAGPELSLLRASGLGTTVETDEFGLVVRGAAGLMLHLSEGVRLNLTPLAFQTYVADGARTYYSATAGLAFALE
jgi:hypothetical protein